MAVFSLSDLPAFFARDGSSDYVVEGVLPIGVTVAYGPTGTGKTGFAVATAMAVATGAPWAGRNVTQGAVIYAATEDLNGVRKRLHGAATAAGGVHDLPIYGTDEATALADPKSKGIVALERTIAEVGVADHLKLIVVDTLAVSFGAFSQDDATHAASFMANMARLSTRYGCAVLVIHHSAKGSSDMRGSGVFRDAANAVLRLAPGSKGSDPTVKVEKQKNDAAEGMFGFTIGSTFITRGQEQAQVSVQAITNLRPLGSEAAQASPEKFAPETGGQIVWRVLEELSANVSPVKVDDWRQACFQARSNGAPKISSSTFSKQLKALQKKGKISVRRDVVSILVSGNFLGNDPPSVSATVATAPLKGAGVGNVEDTTLEDVLAEASKLNRRIRSVG